MGSRAPGAGKPLGDGGHLSCGTKRKERRREWWGFLGLAIANLVYTLALTGTGS